MEKTSIMRLLRLKYGISLRELAKTAGVSHQYLSDIELGKCAWTEHTEAVIQGAFEQVVTARRGQARQLLAAYHANRGRLLEFVDVDNEEGDYDL